MRRRYILRYLARGRNGKECRAAFSESIYVGRGGVKVGPSYHRYYNPYEGGHCSELRHACLR